MAKPWYSFSVAKATGDLTVSIFDEIGAWGYSAADFKRDLDAADSGKGKITIRLNTPGGSVFDGFAIYNMLNRVRDRSTVIIEGLAASMGSVIAMAGKTVVMPENAMLMIHDPVGLVGGGPEEIASFADGLSKMRDSIAKAYTDRTGKSEEEIRQLMAKETWLTAQEAVNMGFADKIEKPIQMAAHAGFDLRCYRNVPTFGTTSSTARETEMKNDEIARLCSALGFASVANTIKEGSTFTEVMAVLEKAKTDKATADAAALAAAPKQEKSADEVRAELLAEISEIKSLCSLAGMEDKADDFIKNKTSVKDVIGALAAAKAAAASSKGKKAQAVANTEVNPRHNPQPHAEGSDAVALDTGKVWDKFNNTGKRK